MRKGQLCRYGLEANPIWRSTAMDTPISASHLLTPYVYKFSTGKQNKKNMLLKLKHTYVSLKILKLAKLKL